MVLLPDDGVLGFGLLLGRTERRLDLVDHLLDHAHRLADDVDLAPDLVSLLGEHLVELVSLVLVGPGRDDSVVEQLVELADFPLEFLLGLVLFLGQPVQDALVDLDLPHTGMLGRNALVYCIN